MLDQACILCGERSSIYLFTDSGTAVYECLDCNLIFRYPAIAETSTPNSIPRTKPEKYAWLLKKIGLSKGRVAVISASDDLSIVDNLKTAGFTGDLLSFANQLEISDSQADTFEAVILANFLERSVRPDSVLNQTRAMLKSNGLIVITFSSLDPLLYGWFDREPSSWDPKTLYFFNRTTMQLLLEKNGFSNIWIGNESELSSTLICTARKSDLNHRQSLSIIMPVYNEKKTFQTALELLLQKQIPEIEKKEIIIVDNKSTDGTREIAQSYSKNPDIKLVFADQFQGKGYAVRTGLKHACGDIILIQDADLEYDIDDYNALLEPIIRYKKVFVLGSRHKGKWKMRSFLGDSVAAILLNSGQIFFTSLLNVLYGQQMTDPLTMYKIFRRECIYGLKLETNGFDFDQELVAKLIRKGYTPYEVRVNYKSRSFSEGKKISMITDPLLCLLCDLKYRIVDPFQPGWQEGPPELLEGTYQ